MSLFEDTAMPGAPYLIAAVMAMWAMLHTYEMPQTDIELAKHGYVGQKAEDSMKSKCGRSPVKEKKLWESKKIKSCKQKWYQKARPAYRKEEKKPEKKLKKE